MVEHLGFELIDRGDGTLAYKPIMKEDGVSSSAENDGAGGGKGDR